MEINTWQGPLGAVVERAGLDLAGLAATLAAMLGLSPHQPVPRSRQGTGKGGGGGGGAQERACAEHRGRWNIGCMEHVYRTKRKRAERRDEKAKLVNFLLLK